ncbi:MAG: hypothetical protein V4850_02885 [Myxococcota bacterium]
MRLLVGFLLLVGCPTADKPDSSDTDPLACGEALTCDATAVCVRDSHEPDCEDRADTGAPCPEGTTASMCGGAGMPCCCGATPEPTYRCYEAGTCGESPTCDCLGAVCGESEGCSSVGSETSRLYACDELPKP